MTYFNIKIHQSFLYEKMFEKKRIGHPTFSNIVYNVLNMIPGANTSDRI